MKKRLKQILSIVLCAIMVFGAIPFSALLFKAEAATDLIWPVPGVPINSYTTYDGHIAMDIAGGCVGYNIVSACSGTVVAKYTHGHNTFGTGSYCNLSPSCYGNGNGLWIQGDDGLYYNYAHMQDGSIPSNIQNGSRVLAGQLIGKVGNTGNANGPHLHFAIASNWADTSTRIAPWTRNYTNSTSSSAPAAPTIETENVIGGVNAILSCSTSGATIYYTLDGSNPSTSSNKYIGKFKITESRNIKAIAIISGNSSTVSSKQVSLNKTDSPTILCDESPYGFYFMISAENSAEIYYTTDGSLPTVNSSKYEDVIFVNDVVVLNAIAVEKGKSISDVESYYCSACIPNTPELRLRSPNKTAKIGDVIFVEWDYDYNAYNYTCEWEYRKLDSDAGGGNFEETEHTYFSLVCNSVGRYSFRVKANNFFGESYYSNTIVVTVLPDNYISSAEINTGSATSIDYKSNVTIKATANNVPDEYYLAMYINGKQVAKGTNTEVTYKAGQITSNINYTVKVIDANGVVQKDSSGKDLAEESTIICNSGFIYRLIAFIKRLFGLFNNVIIEP